jgi:hypothetical protein
MRQETGYCLLIAAAFFVTLYFMHHHSRNSISIPSDAVAVGNELPQIIVLKERKDIYHAWKERDMRHRVVVHFDCNMQMKPFKYIRPEFINGIYIGISDLFNEDELDNETFMFYAAANGITRGIVGILPEDVFRAKGEEIMKSGYVYHKDRYEGIVFGIPRVVTTFKGLKHFEEPILLSFDARFFSHSGVLPDELYQKIKTMGIKVDIVAFSRSIGDKEVTAEGIEKLDRLIDLFRGHENHFI